MDNVSGQDTALLRELAKQVCEAAALPVMAKRRRQWAASNDLHPERPMVCIDQVCWHEMNVDDELTLRTSHPVCRAYEDMLRKTLYRVRHMPADLVVEPFLEVPRVIRGYTTGFVDWQESFDCGLAVENEEISTTDADNDIVSHKYLVQIETEDDIEKIKMPVIEEDKAASGRQLAFVQELFGESIEVRQRGCYPAFKLWDTLLQWCGMENLLVGFLDEPEFMHALAERLTTAFLTGLDQLEAQGLLGGSDALVHCTGAYTNQLHPTPGAVKASDQWTLNLSQIFSSTSKEMHEEFEATYSRRWFARFGLGYYGCCEPLHDRIDMVRSIPHIRKISTSPWAKVEQAAEAMGGDYVLSRKPNPSLFAGEQFDLNEARRELEGTMAICARTGTPVEFIQKDLSTVRRQPQRLWDWARLAAEVTGGER